MCQLDLRPKLEPVSPIPQPRVEVRSVGISPAGTAVGYPKVAQVSKNRDAPIATIHKKDPLPLGVIAPSVTPRCQASQGGTLGM